MNSAVQNVLAEPVAGGDVLEAALHRALAGARAGAPFACITVPAPVVSPERLIAGVRGDALAWDAPGRFGFCALGEAASVAAAGPTRFDAVRRAGGDLLAQVASQGILGAAAVPVRLFGGLSFSGDEPASELWQPFGAARFVLPALGYLRTGDQASLFVTVRRGELATPGVRALVVERVLAGLDALAAEPRADLGVADGYALRERPVQEWMALVESIRREIAAGALEKVVLARRVRVDFAREPDPALVLRRLRGDAPQCVRFLVRRGASSFIGATPERLVHKRGLAVETEALAGSMSALDAGGEQRLLESTKDSAEHAIVLREIQRALAPLVDRVEHDRKPELTRLRHVLHLRTRVCATLREPCHLLEVVQRLHPTPAVGGWPRAAALEWIARHEPDERGWYAGPIGWFDANGDGEMAVALRSGVLSGRSAHLFVGCGIVGRSNPAQEFAETRWKLATLLGALGAV